MSRIVIPSSTDWLQSADVNSGTVFVEGRLAEMLHPELWHNLTAAYAALDPYPWDYSGGVNHATRNNGVRDKDGAWNFDGTTGSYISLPLTAKLVAGAQAMSLWIRTSYAGVDDKFLFACDQTATGGWFCRGYYYYQSAGWLSPKCRPCLTLRFRRRLTELIPRRRGFY
jgi:hypothetical protein